MEGKEYILNKSIQCEHQKCCQSLELKSGVSAPILITVNTSKPEKEKSEVKQKPKLYLSFSVIFKGE